MVQALLQIGEGWILMTQKSPLLSFKIRCSSPEQAAIESSKYDIVSGLWMNSAGQPVIEKYITDNITNLNGKTTISETRESIDRSEGTNFDVDDKALDFSNVETLLTKTREGADRSEGSNSGVESLVFESIETATREGIDRAELSYDFMTDEGYQVKSRAIDETLITRSREGADSSERADVYEYSEPSFGTTQTYTRESIDRSEGSH